MQKKSLVVIDIQNETNSFQLKNARMLTTISNAMIDIKAKNNGYKNQRKIGFN